MRLSSDFYFDSIPYIWAVSTHQIYSFNITEHSYLSETVPCAGGNGQTNTPAHIKLVF